MEQARTILRRLYPYITRNSILWNELESAAMYGLADAAIKFDSECGKSFYPLMRIRVIGEIRRCMRREMQQGDIGIVNLPDENERVDMEEYKPDDIASPPLEHEILIREQLRIFKEALTKLVPSRRHRQIILKFIEGWEMPELGRKYGISKQAVDDVLKRYMPKIREYINERK